MRGFLILCFCVPIFSFGQKTLSFQQFYDMVLKYHPVAKQANLLTEQAQQELVSARGGFDPKIYHEKSEKEFENKNYFDLNNSGFKIPTWFGIEVKAGYEYNNGDFLNPENNVTTNGVTYAGVSIPVGKGLLMDKRRAALRQAQIFAEQSEVDRLIVLNKVLLDASTYYWKWVNAYQTYQIFDTAIAVSEERFNAVKQSFIFGDMPGIDTLEAYIQFQTREIQTQEAFIEYAKNTLLLSTFLWLDDNTPLEIGDSLIPELPIPATTLGSIKNLLDSLGTNIRNIPQVSLYDFKLRSLDIDRRLKAEKLKPELDLNYNFLRRDIGAPEFIFDNNYKWGLTFSFPIFIREARGAVRATNLKIDQTQLKLQNKQREVENKLRAIFAQLSTNNDLIDMTRDNVDNYQRLYDLESLKLRVGESSLFKLNDREIKLLDAQAKLAKFQTYQWIYYYQFLELYGRLY